MQNEVIRSRQNRLVKLVCSLERKKLREELGLFRFDGIKLCLEALSKGLVPEYIFVCESRYDELRARVGEQYELTVVCDDVFFKMSDEKSPEGIITVIKLLDLLHRNVIVDEKGVTDLDVGDNERVFILESIRDPGNLGTIIRTAASLGVDRIVMTSDCADIYNPKTIRGAMGALFMQRTDTVKNEQLGGYIHALQKRGRRVYAAALRSDAQRLGELELFSSDAFIIGNEGHGLSEGTIAACDGCVIIPMREGCESLNAAMAAGILMWETLRSEDRR